MPACYTRPFCLLAGSVLLVLAGLAATGCDEATLGPETQGQIEGVVQDAETNAPIPDANVTTAPPTQSLLTGADGTFTIEAIPTGNYSITASKSDYESRTVQVNVQESQAASATILLERDDDFGAESDSLAAQVTNWFNDRVNRDTTGADSLFADVEYRVRNVGDTDIENYEVYFEIDTAEGAFSFEAKGDTLAVDQQDIGGFRKYIPSEAQDVRVDDVYWSAR